MSWIEEIDKETLRLFKESQDDFKEIVIQQLIDYCRAKQKEYVEDGGSVSGVSILEDMLKKKELTFEQMLNIYPAVNEYNAPYELNLKRDE